MAADQSVRAQLKKPTTSQLQSHGNTDATPTDSLKIYEKLET